MKTLRNSLMALLATGTILTATSASALPQDWWDDLPAWTATASSCSVDESSGSKYEFSGTQFRYLGGNVSDYGLNASRNSNISITPTYKPITVRCNVTPVYDYVPAIPAAPGDLFGTPASWKSADWNTLIVGYKDADGISTNAQVSASLRKVSRATLGETTLATFNSNLSANTAANEDIKQFTHTFDFKNNDYYVEINLIRKNTTVATPVAYSVRLAKGGVAAIIH
ncbi:MAG: hypothetical protein PHR16_07035 [Methylovulum sp.]|nr:hypothetical protein [Methylovulum sp.]